MIDQTNMQTDPARGPFDIEAEMCFLASLAICEDSARQHRLRAALSWHDFYQPDHALIFQGMCGVLDPGRPLDAVTLRAEMRNRGTWDDVGGDEYAGKILNKVPSANHGEHYAAIVGAHAISRAAAEQGRKLNERLMLPAVDETAVAVIDETINALLTIRQRRNRVQVFSLGDIVADFLSSKDDNRPNALMTGISSLDAMAGVFAFGKYTIIAGRPSMGKSTFLRWLLQLWASAGTPVGLVAVEEDRQKIAGNYLSAASGIENHVMAYQAFDLDNAVVAAKAGVSIAGYPWYGVDTAFSISEVCNAVDVLATEKKCKVVAVDHLHLIKPDRFQESEQREVKEVSRRLKEIGKRHGIVLIAAAQLSRPPDKVKMPPPPTLTDLRASGAIEEHADAAILLHREDYYRRSDPTHLCEIIIAKNRNGRRGNFGLYEELPYQRFREPTENEELLWNMPECPV